MNVLTIGTFDGLHVGHLELLRACHEMAGERGKVIVAVNRDQFVRRYKGHDPKQPLEHRMEMLQALRVVDEVVVNSGDEDADWVIGWVSPDAIAIGDDWLDADHDQTRYLAQLGISEEWLSERGLTVTYVPRTRGVSSTALR